MTRRGALVALVDPLDRLDPASAAATGVDLARLLWLRGPRVASEEPSPRAFADATAAVATLASSGILAVVALDLTGAGRERRRLPGATWLRLARLVEDTATAVVLLGSVLLVNAAAPCECGCAGGRGGDGVTAFIKEIEVQDLRLAYDSKEVLHGITFDVFRNEILAVIGPAQSGKTSMLRCLNRTIDFTASATVSGQVRVAGEDVRRTKDIYALRRKIGMVAPLPTGLSLTIYANVAFAPGARGSAARAISTPLWSAA